MHNFFAEQWKVGSRADLEEDLAEEKNLGNFVLEAEHDHFKNRLSYIVNLHILETSDDRQSLTFWERFAH